MFHRCPAKRHTQSNDPSNGTFVASNVRIHECTPSQGGDHDSPSSQAALATRAFPCISKRYISLVFQALPRRQQGFVTWIGATRSESPAASRIPLYIGEVYKPCVSGSSSTIHILRLVRRVPHGVGLTDASHNSLDTPLIFIIFSLAMFYNIHFDTL